MEAPTKSSKLENVGDSRKILALKAAIQLEVEIAFIERGNQVALISKFSR
jgi:hypothetical protein